MSFKPYIDSPCDFGIAEDVAFNLYAMECEGASIDHITFSLKDSLDKRVGGGSRSFTTRRRI